MLPNGECICNIIHHCEGHSTGTAPQQWPLLLRRGRARADIPPCAALGQRLQGGPAGRPLLDRARPAPGGLRRLLPQLQRRGRHPQWHRCRRSHCGAEQDVAAIPCCAAGKMSPSVACNGMAAADSNLLGKQPAAQRGVAGFMPSEMKRQYVIRHL